MNFESGSKVVHRTHGVGTICGIEAQNYGAGQQDYYLLRIEASGLMVRFPKDVETSLVRNLVNDDEIKKVYAILQSPPKNYSMVWNRRKKEFTEKIKSGSIYEIAEVMRDLSQQKTGKDLSFGEKEMLEKARERIITEISAAESKSTEAVDEELDALMKA
mgnify:FL=1